MYKTLLLVFVLMLSLSAISAADYIIGTGTSTQIYVPTYGYVNYNWSKFCFSAAEMQAAGFTEAQPIERIAFEVGNEVSNYVMDDQRVYMRAWYDYEYLSNNVSYPGTAGFSEVFVGSVTWEGPGWVEIILDTPYSYNPTWGLEILWENRDGSRVTGYPRFCYESTENYSAVRHSGSSGSFPTTNGTRSRANRPNIWFVTPTIDPPNPAAAVLPANGATGVNIDTLLRWNHTGGTPSGYRLWLGTDNPPSNIVAAQIQSPSFYSPQNRLEYGTTYYWRVVPFNENGSAYDCPVWSFTTMDDPSIVSFPHLETFDGAFPPSGWAKHAGTLIDPITLGASGSGLWEQDNWLNITDGDMAARINVWGSVSGFIISPLFNVPTDDYVLEFDVAVLRYNQTPEGTPPNYNNTDDQFAILIGDGFSWSTANIAREWNNAGSDYVLHDIPVYGQRMTIPLTGHTGRIRVAIFAGSVTMDDDNDVMVNNFRIGLPEAGLAQPELHVSIDPVTNQPLLSWEAVPGASLYRIYRAEDPYGVFIQVDTSTETSYQITEPYTKEFFKITAE